jgi:hypothetical protein
MSAWGISCVKSITSFFRRIPKKRNAVSCGYNLLEEVLKLRLRLRRKLSSAVPNVNKDRPVIADVVAARLVGIVGVTAVRTCAVGNTVLHCLDINLVIVRRHTATAPVPVNVGSKPLMLTVFAIRIAFGNLTSTRDLDRRERHGGLLERLKLGRGFVPRHFSDEDERDLLPHDFGNRRGSFFGKTIQRGIHLRCQPYLEKFRVVGLSSGH